MNSKQSGRRRFLQGSAAVLGAAALDSARPANAEEASQPAVIPVSGVRPVSEISQYEKLVRTGNTERAMTPLQDLQGIITPSHLHFYMNHEQGYLPNIDPEKHTLTIFGMVDRPLVLTMADIKQMPAVSRIHFLECNANGNPSRVREAKNIQDAHGLTSCAEWTGVPFSQLMHEVGVQRNAQWIIAMSADTSNHASSIPIEKAMSDGMIVYGQNGDALRIDHGYPLRLLLPGYGGRINVKWLDRLKIVDQPYMTKQDRTSYMRHTPAGEGAFMLTSGKALDWHFSSYAKSVITSPTGGQKLPGPGLYDITGLAWSGSGAVRRVEVSTDGGRTWKDAQLQEPILRIAHTRFHFPWRWNGEQAKLQSRCTDEHGTVQPSAAEIEKNWDEDLSAACTEYMGDDCKRIPRRAHRAYIMTWQVNRDGTVLNASNDLPDDDLLKGGGIHH